MPVPYLIKLSKETGKSVNDLEKLWSKAKKIASEHFNKPESEFGDSEFAYVIGIVKNMVGVKEGTDWSRVEKDLKSKPLKFDKYGVILGRYTLELIELYEDDEDTAILFYSPNGFRYLDGREFPLAMVTEYQMEFEEVRKNLSHPNEIKLFSDLTDAWKYLNKYYGDAFKLSHRDMIKDFWRHKRMLLESITETFTLSEDVKIPGTDYVIKKGQTFEFEDATDENEKLTESMNFDFNKFERLIPHNMRWKEANIVGDVLYWVTQEFFDAEDLEQFEFALRLMRRPSGISKAYVICRDYSHYDYVRDRALGKGVFIDLDIRESKVKNEHKKEVICITEECRIPGTNIVLETGDKIAVVKESIDSFIVTLSADIPTLNWYMRRLQMHIVAGLMNAKYDMELDRSTKTLAVVFNNEKDANQLVKTVTTEKKGATTSVEKV